MKKLFLILLLPFIFIGCYEQERKCSDFKTGSFEFEIITEKDTLFSVFTRNDSIQIETFEGKTDTSTVRWINDCEFVLRKKNPKSMADKKDIHMKILTTSEREYVFEFGYVGDTNKQKGTVKKTTK